MTQQGSSEIYFQFRRETEGFDRRSVKKGRIDQIGSTPHEEPDSGSTSLKTMIFLKKKWVFWNCFRC